MPSSVSAPSCHQRGKKAIADLLCIGKAALPYAFHVERLEEAPSLLTIIVHRVLSGARDAAAFVRTVAMVVIGVVILFARSIVRR